MVSYRWLKMTKLRSCGLPGPETDKMVMANQPDIVVVDKVIDVGIPSNTTIKKKEHKTLEKYLRLKEELEKMWKMKATVVPVVISVLGATAPNW